MCSLTVALTLAEQVDNRICVKFYCKLEYKSTETIRMINKAFQDDSMSETLIKVWYKHFKEGRESTISDPRSGRSSASKTSKNVGSVKTAINENRRLTIRELEDDLGIPRTSVSEILTEDVGMARVAQNSSLVS
ncbi:protein GVQW3-like [Oratosquilla oratoria]|uniref:protein GVQW3-like n=1 Tax=Oratosquilla oratoria TaxID=337810 RepID=UPI003F75D400